MVDEEEVDHSRGENEEGGGQGGPDPGRAQPPGQPDDPPLLGSFEPQALGVGESRGPCSRHGRNIRLAGREVVKIWRAPACKSTLYVRYGRGCSSGEEAPSDPHR